MKLAIVLALLIASSGVAAADNNATTTADANANIPELPPLPALPENCGSVAQVLVNDTCDTIS